MTPAAADERLSRADATHVVRRLASMLRDRRGELALATAVVVGQTLCLLAGPWLVKRGVDAGLIGDDPRALNVAAVLYLVSAVLGLLFGRWAIWLVNRVGERFLRDLRVRAFRHVLDLGMDFYEREPTGRLVSRLTSDVDIMEQLVSQGLVMFVQNALLLVGAVVAVFAMSWPLALCTLVIVPPVVWVTRWFQRASGRAYVAVRERIGETLTTLQEGLEGVRVVQAFNRQGGFISKFRRTNEAQYEANLEAVRISVRYFPVIELAGVVGIAVIVGMGAYFVDRGTITVGVVLAFVLYLNNLFEPIQQLGQLYNTVQQSGAGLHKILVLLDTPCSVPERPDGVELPRRGDLEVSGVSFGYGDGVTPDTDGVVHPAGPDVLSGVDLTVAAGERLALVGPTGAGKSTLAKLLVRFYDPRRGRVSFGGVDLRDARTSSLRDRIVVVPQEGFLFAGTIRDNIALGRPDADAAAVEAAVDRLGLAGLFEGFPAGLDTEVRERGSRLSAGEKQLVSLARAALADPAVLVLDEATSNLDPGTEQRLEEALDHLTEGRTVVVVAHRLTTAARCDRIAVVDGGRLAELGSHADLVARGGHYARLWRAWDSTAPTGGTAADLP
ncbi:MAG: ABC transporter ATP-binding protein/permease [Acidimicrobiia bacterium]|nr:ABC transporter ATP-binding protein/permease [Acidimicrobiia bacterium]